MQPDGRRIAVIGAGGFIGRNLVVRLEELGWRPDVITRATPAEDAATAIQRADVIFHLAGVNRPGDPTEFARCNEGYTAWLAEAVRAGGRAPLVVFASSTQAGAGTGYGRSKLACEQILADLAQEGHAQALVCRLPNVFGKWARPNYNSVVATFCHNIARGLPIRVDDPSAELTLLYVDELVDQWTALLSQPAPLAPGRWEPTGTHSTTVGEVARTLRRFAEGRLSCRVDWVGEGLERALYATFVAALPQDAFSYPLQPHTDARGSFTEMLKTPGSGQVSYFTAHPGVTRGGHYHHSKVEKFLIVHGEALFRFRHILSGELYEVRTSARSPVVVETVPGWTHDVTNVGDGDMISLIWANEVFDRERPDTVLAPV